MTRKITEADVEKMFFAAVQTAIHAGEVQGRLGKPTATSTWVYDVPGGRGWKYVQIVAANGESASITQALNQKGVPDTGDLAIWLGKNLEGKLAIIDYRFDGV